MRFEVEQKHRVDDVPALVAELAERGVALGAALEQSDRYFAHPCRDFARTDEALRIRTVGEASYVTFKGPKIDATTKTRSGSWNCRSIPVTRTDPSLPSC